MSASRSCGRFCSNRRRGWRGSRRSRRGLGKLLEWLCEKLGMGVLAACLSARVVCCNGWPPRLAACSRCGCSLRLFSGGLSSNLSSNLSSSDFGTSGLLGRLLHCRCHHRFSRPRNRRGRGRPGKNTYTRQPRTTSGEHSHLHPTPWHIYPEMQHPPPRSDGQLTASEGHSLTAPSHCDPRGQQATCPTSVSGTSVQYVPSWQHLFGEPMSAQLFMPEGHDDRLSRMASTSAARRMTPSCVSSS